MINSFTINGADSFTDMGLYIEERPQPGTVGRAYEAVKVEGRDDLLYIDKGSYQNISLQYKVACADIDSHIQAIMILFSEPGYVELKDTYTPGYYRRAFVVNPIKFTEELLNFGHAVIEFSADPYLYRDDGKAEHAVTTRGITLTNPEIFYEAKPLIVANGTSGSTITLFIEARSYAFKIPTGKTKITIDCLNQTAYSGNDNACKYLLFEEFPYLDIGSISVSRQGGTSLYIIPKWRRLG